MSVRIVHSISPFSRFAGLVGNICELRSSVDIKLWSIGAGGGRVLVEGGVGENLIFCAI
jgi:hypothetical protein